MDNLQIPVSTDPMVNTVDEDMVDSTPAEIEDFITEHGISDHKYTCYVKQYPPEGGGTPVSLPWNHNSKYPTARELGEDFGPGKYLIMFTGTFDNSTTNQTIDIQIVIDGSAQATSVRTIDIKIHA